MSLAQSYVTDNIEKFFDDILDVFHDGIYITDASGKTLKVNNTYEKLTGLKREELIGRNVLDLEKEGVYSIALNPKVVKTSTSQTSIQTTKANRKVVLNSHPVFDQGGNVAYVVTYVRDITVLSKLKDQVFSQGKLIEKYHHEAQYLRNKNLQNKNTIIQSPKMSRLMELLKRIAQTDTTALIMGETGVGKDVFAKEIHEHSDRNEKPFLKINCATIPETLIESELFGYAPGAFSGANTKGKPGYFEMADNGTLFLDEIGELPLQMQAKLLRVLQDQEVMRVGSTKVKKIDVRFIAATNRNLDQAIKQGTFRSDLYYRLHVAVLNLPPLRERREEIEPLVNHFLNKFNTKYKKNMSFSQKALDLMHNYSWPGNVREVENLIQGIVVTRDKEFLDVEDLPIYITNNDNNNDSDFISSLSNIGNRTLKDIMDEAEKNILAKALDKHGSIPKVAKAFNVDRSTIFRKLKKYSLI
ncbi:MAG: PAS domain S-box protein [Firmicutes bacterium]|nr:PAS domain S-box protein [Bacillota bacterium]